MVVSACGGGEAAGEDKKSPYVIGLVKAIVEGNGASSMMGK